MQDAGKKKAGRKPSDANKHYLNQYQSLLEKGDSGKNAMGKSYELMRHVCYELNENLPFWSPDFQKSLKATLLAMPYQPTPNNECLQNIFIIASYKISYDDILTSIHNQTRELIIDAFPNIDFTTSDDFRALREPVRGNLKSKSAKFASKSMLFANISHLWMHMHNMTRLISLGVVVVV